MAINYPQRYDDDFLNTIKTVIDHVNVHGKTIQDLVAEGQLTEAQYAELITVINGHLKSGDVDKFDLSPMLQEEIDRVNTMRVNTNDHPIDVDEMNTRTKQLFTGGAVAVVGENSVGRENIKVGAVLPEATTFFESDSKNIFDGNFTDGWIAYSSLGDGLMAFRRNTDTIEGKTAIIKIEPNTTYNLKIVDESAANVFRVALNNSYPTYSSEYENALDNIIHNRSSNTSETELSITTTGSSRYLIVYLSNAGKEPRLQVEKGSAYTGFNGYSDFKIPDKYIDLSNLELLPENIKGLIKKSDKNIFSSGYYDGWIALTEYQDGTKKIALRENTESIKGKMAIEKVEPNTKYHIQVVDEELSNTFRVVLSNQEPKYSVDYEYPLDELVYDHVAQGNKSELTVTTGSDTEYIVAYVSNEGKTPRLQIEKGDTFTGYENGYEINPDFLSTAQDNNSKGRNDAFKFNYFTNLDKLYTHDEITDYIQNPETMTVAEYHGMFNSLIDAHPEISKSTYLGKAEFDYDLYQYETTPEPDKILDGQGLPNLYPNRIVTDEPLAKIVITAGIHGREKAASYASYYFFRELMENPTNDPLIDFIKRNVKLIFVPIICPSGFEDNTYENRNGMNLNRDFAPYGNFTQKETQLVKQVLDEHADMDFHLDFHTTRIADGTLGYTLTNDPVLGAIGNNMYRELGRYWQMKTPEMPQDINHIWGYTTHANIGTAGLYTEKAHGIPSAIFETVWEDAWLGGGVHSEVITRRGVEMLCNMIIGSLRAKQHGLS